MFNVIFLYFAIDRDNCDLLKPMRLMDGSNRQVVRIQPYSNVDFNNSGEGWGFSIFFNPGCCSKATVLANEPLYDCHACLLVLITGHLQVS